ncbi:MAG: polysaccharide biosynthesis C-terminal domain-containing protein [Reinekea sp.]
MLNAFEKLKIQATFGIASAFINVLLIIPFVKYFGIVGAPLATTIAHLFFGVIPLSIVLYRYFKHESIAH